MMTAQSRDFKRDSSAVAGEYSVCLSKYLAESAEELRGDGEGVS